MSIIAALDGNILNSYGIFLHNVFTRSRNKRDPYLMRSNPILCSRIMSQLKVRYTCEQRIRVRSAASARLDRCDPSAYNAIEKAFVSLCNEVIAWSILNNGV